MVFDWHSRNNNSRCKEQINFLYTNSPPSLSLCSSSLKTISLATSYISLVNVGNLCQLRHLSQSVICMKVKFSAS